MIDSSALVVLFRPYRFSALTQTDFEANFWLNPISEIRKKYFNFFGAHERACVRGHALARVQDKPVRFVTAKYLFQPSETLQLSMNALRSRELDFSVLWFLCFFDAGTSYVLICFKWAIHCIFFNFVFSIQFIVSKMPMIGFEPRISDVGTTHSTICATSTA